MFVFTAVQRVSAPLWNTCTDEGVHFIVVPVFLTLEMPSVTVSSAFLRQHLPCSSVDNETNKPASSFGHGCFHTSRGPYPSTREPA